MRRMEVHRDDESQGEGNRKSREEKWIEMRRHLGTIREEDAGNLELPLSKDTVFYSYMNMH